MADQLNMGGLNLGDNGRPAYIPPHMRGKMGGGPGPGPGPVPGPPAGMPVPGPDMNGGLNNSAWNKLVPFRPFHPLRTGFPYIRGPVPY